MTRIGFVADVHIGNHRKHGGEMQAGLNSRCRASIAALRRAVDTALAHEVEAFVICGDLFDSARPSPQIVAAVQVELDRVATVVLVGNHDRMSDDEGDHACAPLNPVANVVDVVEQYEFGGVELLAVPYRSGNARDWFWSVLTDTAPLPGCAHRLIAFHLGVEDEKTERFLKGAHDSIHKDALADAMRAGGFSHAFAGNWHEHRHWEFQWPDDESTADVVQVGTLCPTGWDNSGLDSGYGRLAIFDTETKRKVSMVEIPGPRFLTVNGPTAADTIIKSAHEDGHDVYARWKAPMSDMEEAQEELQEWIASGLIAGGHVQPDDEQAEAAARKAATVARKAETLGEALAAFVGEMPLEEGIDRAQVLAKANEYLGGAA